MLNPSFLQELDLFISQNYVEDNSIKTKGLPREQLEEIDNEIRKNKKSFIEILDEMLKKYNENKKEELKPVALYKRAGITRQTYHKLLEKDRPSKDTAVMYSLALELCEDDMGKLLASAGYSLASNSKRDLILKYCFMKRIYDYTDVCEILKCKEEKLFRAI
jgi:hydroxymethylpyrimidine pyrophosphatase-like HAD family hydrolase